MLNWSHPSYPHRADGTAVPVSSRIVDYDNSIVPLVLPNWSSSNKNYAVLLHQSLHSADLIATDYYSW